jgi:hypothetical protein
LKASTRNTSSNPPFDAVESVHYRGGPPDSAASRRRCLHPDPVRQSLGAVEQPDHNDFASTDFRTLVWSNSSVLAAPPVFRDFSVTRGSTTPFLPIVPKMAGTEASSGARLRAPVCAVPHRRPKTLNVSDPFANPLANGRDCAGSQISRLLQCRPIRHKARSPHGCPGDGWGQPMARTAGRSRAGGQFGRPRVGLRATSACRSSRRRSVTSCSFGSPLQGTIPPLNVSASPAPTNGPWASVYGGTASSITEKPRRVQCFNSTLIKGRHPSGDARS